VITGTLANMAPEQTGRMNRSVDSRSDLYALGRTVQRPELVQPKTELANVSGPQFTAR
jgi:serine/threonine protein kinase